MIVLLRPEPGTRPTATPPASATSASARRAGRGGAGDAHLPRAAPRRALERSRERGAALVARVQLARERLAHAVVLLARLLHRDHVRSSDAAICDSRRNRPRHEPRGRED